MFRLFKKQKTPPTGVCADRRPVVAESGRPACFTAARLQQKMKPEAPGEADRPPRFF